MLNLVYDIYTFLFARKQFLKLNKFFYALSLRGMGVLNSGTDKVNGEAYFISNYVSDIAKGVIFDVGANVGSYSTAIRKANENALIYSFEPHPATFKKLLENTINLKVEVFNVAVGATNGALSLYDYADKDGSSHASVYQEVIEQIHHQRAIAHEVDIITLDSFSIEHNIDRVSLLKIDTEGHELEVLKGFRQFIKENRVDLIHFEFNEMNVASRIFFRDFWDFLPNYDLYRMLPAGLAPIKKYSPVFCEIFAYQNIVAKLKSEYVQ